MALSIALVSVALGTQMTSWRVWCSDARGSSRINLVTQSCCSGKRKNAYNWVVQLIM